MGRSVQDEILAGLHRRFELRMSVGGDTWDDLKRLAREFAEAVEKRDPDCISITLGGYSSGGYVFVLEDPEMTHERWQEDLDVYVDKLRQERTQ